MKIRVGQAADLSSIQRVIETAFPEDENKAIIDLAAEFFHESSHSHIKSLVAEVDGQVIGYVSYSPISLKEDANTNISGYILAPLAVAPEYQKHGVGTSLVRSGMDMLANDGVDVLLVYGDPNYYGRFGFQEEIARSFQPPYPLKYPLGWLGRQLNQKTIIPSIPVPVPFGCVAGLSKPELW